MKFRRIKAALCGLLLVSSLTLTACGSGAAPKGNIGEVTLEPGDKFAIIKIVDYGEITVKLFPDVAPLAVEQFTTLAKRGYYDGKNIHRVIADYIIQGGSLCGDGTDGKVADNAYIQVETSDKARNYYGALCFAKSDKGNNCQFYIVSEKTSVDLDEAAKKVREQLADETIAAKLPEDKKTYFNDYCSKIEKLPTEVKEKYKEVGGAYNLDGENTVFGQTVEGFDVIDAIASSAVVSGNAIDDASDVASRPAEAIIIESIEVVDIPLPVVTSDTTEATKKRKTKTTTTEPTTDASAETNETAESVTSLDTTVSPDESTEETAATASSADTSATTAPVTTATAPRVTTAAVTTAAATVATTTEEVTSEETEATEEPEEPEDIEEPEESEEPEETTARVTTNASDTEETLEVETEDSEDELETEPDDELEARIKPVLIT